MVGEPAGRLAGGETEHGRADQAFRSGQVLAGLEPSWYATAGEHGLLAQTPVPGRLAIVQSVFDHGELVAFHATARIREGVWGGSSHKRGIDLPVARQHLEHLGGRLGWHGALSADVILGADGPSFIDINPRLVEPINALRSGVDLVGALVSVARGIPVRPQPPARAGINSHQLLVAILGAAQRGGRRAVLSELAAALGHRGYYRDSTEELTPTRRDPRSAVLLATAVAATLVRPSSWTFFASGSVRAYALTPAGWSSLIDHSRQSTVDADSAGQEGQNSRNSSESVPRRAS